MKPITLIALAVACFATIGNSFAQTNHLLISQVYGGASNSGSTYQNDFIELFNPTGSNIGLSGMSIQYGSQNGTTWTAVALSGTVNAGKYFLIKCTTGSGSSGTALPAFDGTAALDLSATAGKVFLANITTALSGANPTANIIDKVGFGGANGFETAAATAPSKTTSIYRGGASKGCKDLDNNSSDFVTGTPVARNSSTASPNPTINVSGASAICIGSSTSITASGASTYVWTGGPSTAGYSVSPTVLTTYTVTGTDADGCYNTATKAVNVNSLPTVSISGTNTICNGSSTTLTASGATSYAWSGGPSTAANTVSPTTNTTYNVTGTDANGCVNTASQLVTVNSLPTVSITGNNTICTGLSTILTASGAFTYAWTGGPSTAANTVSPTTNTTYNVTGTDANGCVNTASQLVTVNPLPTVSISVSPSATVNSGTSVTLSGAGASTYAWSDGITDAVPFTANTTTTYTVTGTAASTGCSNTASQTINVNGAGLNFDGVDDYVSIQGGSNYLSSVTDNFTIEFWANPTATRGVTSEVNSGHWGYGIGTGQRYAIDPLWNVTDEANAGVSVGTNGVSVVELADGYMPTTLVYNASIIGWTHIAVVYINRTPSLYINGVFVRTGLTSGSARVHPSISLGGNGYGYYQGSLDEVRTWDYARTPAEIQQTMNCEIQTVAYGLKSNYHFNQGIASGTNTGITTLTDASGNGYSGTLTNMTLTGSTSNWTSPGAVTTGTSCIVNPTVPTLNASTSVNCGTVATTLNIASGGLNSATNWQWYSGSCGGTSVGSGISVSVSPATTTTYYARGEGGVAAGSCGSITITVNPIPTVSITGNNTICSGLSTTLTASGASTYSWSNQASTAVNSVTPSTTTTYTVTGTDANGCANTASQLVTVNDLPTIFINGNTSICAGSSTTLTASGASTYAWTSGPATAANTVSPTTTTTYTVTGTDANACSNTASQMVTVNAIPTVTATASPSSITSGLSSTLAASGAASYLWSNGNVNASQSVTPATTTAYSVTGTTNGCSSTASVTVNVISSPNGNGDTTKVKTKLTAAFCGATLATTTTTFGCVQVTNATNYEYEFTDVATGVVTFKTIGSYSTAFNLHNNAPALEVYNKTYNVRVRAYVAGGWGVFGTVCQLSTPSTLPATKLTNAYCGATLATTTTTFFCDGVASATNFEFEFTDMATNVVTLKTTGSYSTAFNLHNVPALEVYGKTYSVRVRAYAGGWGSFGTACQLSTPSTVPVSKLTNTFCGATLATATTTFGCDAVASATNYEYEFTDMATNVITTKTRGSYSTAFNLNMVPQLAVNGKSYSVRVRAFAGSWGAFGTPCQLNTPSGARLANPLTENAEEESTKEGNAKEQSSLVTVKELVVLQAYPNPSNGSFTLQSKMSGKYMLMNELGQVIRTYTLSDENNNTQLIDGLSAGLYIIVTNQAEGTVSHKIIVTQ